MDRERPLEETQETLTEHLEAALEHVDDETARFHLRQANQIAVDLPTLVARKEAESDD
jgi:hypothetical protein